jgi:disulfide oxidoreductase YuzD
LTFRTNQTGVWENFELNSDYNLHFIFIHNQENNEDERKIAQRIKQKIYAFSNKYLKPIGLERQ